VGSALRWMALGRLSAQLVSWAATIFVLRLLRPEDYGLAAICTAVVGAVAIVSDFALSAGLVQARDLRHEQLRGVLGAVLLIAMACTTTVWLAAPALGAFFDSPQAVPMIRVAALQLLFGPWTAVPDAMLRRQLRFQSLAGVEFVSIVAASALTLALALGGANAWALVLGPIGGAAVRLSMLYIAAPTRLWPSLEFAPARGLIRFGATMATSRVAGYVFGQSDIWIAARAFPGTQLGEYSVAMQLAMLPMSKAMAILNDVLFPLVAKMSRDGEDTRTRFLDGLRLGMYVAVPVLWGLALAAADLLPLLIGTKWSNAVPIVQIISTLLPLRAVNVALATMLQGSGRADLDLRNTLTGALILPPLFVAGAFHGPPGLAGAWAVGLPIVVIVNLARCRHALGISPLLVAGAALARPLALGVALATVGIGVRSAVFGSEPSWAALVVTAVSSQTVYWALLSAVDREMLNRLLGFTGLRPERPSIREP
jgi:O-antigen/teichoic acid export membrane protein